MLEPEKDVESEEQNDVEDDFDKKKWKFTQWFRKMQNDGNNPEQQLEDANYITAVEFDETGVFLATGTQLYNLFNLSSTISSDLI